MGEFMKKIPIQQYFRLGGIVEFLIEVRNYAENLGAPHLSEDAIKIVQGQLEKMSLLVGHLDMVNSQAQIEHIKEVLAEKEVGFDTAAALFSCLKTDCFTDMTAVFAGYIPKDRAKYWGQTHPFGEAVYNCYPSARADFTAAGNCYAVEQYTACVFHCMRVAEKGLRAIAREQGIKLIKDKPLEWNDWGRIIQAVESEANKLAVKMKPGPGRDKALEFYRDAAGELYGFKDAYRNYVTHDRATYDVHQAASVYQRVGGFMQRLSTKLDETNPKSIKWGK